MSQPLVIFDAETRARLVAMKSRRRRGRRGLLEGRARSNAPLRGQTEFADHLPYSLGDDVRRLDWNLYGRLDQLFVRRYLGDGAAEIVFLIDGSASMAFGEPEKDVFARRLVAALAISSIASSVKVRIGRIAERTVVENAVFRGLSDENELLAVLEAMPRPAAKADWSKLAEAFASRSQRAELVIVSDFFDDGVARALESVRRHMTTLIAVHAPNERDPGDVGAVTLDDVETSERVSLYLDEARIERYRELFDAHVAAVADHARRVGARHEPTSSNAAFDRVAVDLLNRGVLA